MTDRPLTETRLKELWGKYRGRDGFSEATAVDMLRAAYDAGMADAQPTDLHHDPRPWQDCTVKDIRKGDLVEARSGDILRISVAHHQGDLGDWHAEDGTMLTCGDRWPLRRIPAHTPPAEEVELPDESGEVLYDVTIMNPDGSVLRTAVAMLDEDGYWMGLWSGEGDSKFDGYQPRSFTSFTLPDGTRARRDGDHEDGTPRFVKVQEEQK